MDSRGQTESISLRYFRGDGHLRYRVAHMIVCVASDRVLLYGNLGGTAGKLYSCPNWDGSFLFSRTFNLYVEAIIMAYGMTARRSRHNALLNKIQAVGQWNVPRRT